ncbi:MAG: ammonium transporter [Planctomycetes bacterium]|nr:ammonium transporter [Planctomycetota bacterium]
MARIVVSIIAALALTCGSLVSAADAPQATSPADAPAAAPAAAADAPKTVEERLAVVEAQAKAATDSLNQVTFNPGDNAWMLMCTALVLLMTLPGLALFYGGLVRRKNVLSTMMQSLAIACIVTVIWTVCGYAIAFGDGGGPDVKTSGFWGGFKQFMMLNAVFVDDKGLLVGAPNGDYAMSIPHGTFCLFQLMFAIITPALICGAYAERMKFTSTALFSALWLFLVYLPLAHMVWGKNGYFNWGFNSNMHGAFDFAGGTVVHISSGVAALMCALFLGKRKGYPHTMMPPHNLPMCFIGASLLWVGWFGFNAGSALCASGLATLAFANTQIATACAAIAWPIAEWILRGKPTVLGGLSGAVAGLVAITPAAGFVTPGGALVIGLVAGALCFATTGYLKRALGYDDALDAFGIHGIGGMWGAIATGIFFSPGVNPNIAILNADLAKALEAGTHPVIWLQIKAVVITAVISVVGSSIVLAAIKYTIGLRVTSEDEGTGLDVTQHGEEGYGEAA